MPSKPFFARKVVMAICFAINLLLAFYLYAGCRTMQSTIGPTSYTVAFATGIASVPLVISISGIALYLVQRAKTGQPKARSAVWITAVMASATICGSVIAEMRISADEIDFFQQVENSRKTEGVENFSRDRCWPAKGTSLLWEKSCGFWATD